MENRSQKFKIVTLGCRTNQYESQVYHDQLESLGFQKAADHEPADVCIVNTCTVTESADSSSRHSIRQLARENPNSKLIVTGCSAEKQPEILRNIEGVTQIVPNAKKEQLITSLFPDEDVPEFAIKRFDAHTRAFVKVQDGCNSYCSYCIIPYVRGRSRSREIPDILREVEGLIANGFKEVVLTGINIGDFDGGKPDESKDTLADLVREVDKIPGLRRLRVSSIDPDEVDDNLLDAIINGKTTCHSMHIVLQSGSNVVLKNMRRKYTRQIFMDTVDRLKTASPDFTFTTDIITGFPGETERDHQETLDMIREVKFAKVHMFPYSDRPKTRASRMPDKVSSDVMRRRKHEMMKLAEEVSYLLRQEYLGRVMTVLTESREGSNRHLISGHTGNFLSAVIESETLKPNELVKVEFIENTPIGLIGRILDNG